MLLEGVKSVVFYSLILGGGLSFASVESDVENEIWGSETVASYEASIKNRGLLSLGAFGKLSQDIQLRALPGGKKKIKPIYKDKTYQIIGVVKKGSKRFYKIKDGSDIGYIYGGTHKSFSRWVKQSWSKLGKLIPQPGDEVRVKRAGGVGMVNGRNNKSFHFIPNGTVLKVRRVYTFKNGKLYYKIKHKAYTGFVSAGKLSKLAKQKSWAVLR